MLSNITIGQYFPGDSWLHRMDPRVKIVLLCLFIIAIFACGSKLAYIGLCLMTAGLIATSGVPASLIFRSLKPLLWIILFSFLIHLVSNPGEVIGKVLIFTVTWEGLYQGLYITVRLSLLIILSALLTYTTSPILLTDALEQLMSPLRRFGVPAHELAMMMTIALRFIPTLLQETDKIIKAQKSRGVDFSNGSIMKRIQNMVPIMVPLFVSAFRRADELALAMEARCYRGGIGRTRMKDMRVAALDYGAMLASSLLLAGMVYLKFCA